MKSFRLTPASQQAILIAGGMLLAWYSPYLGIPLALAWLLPIVVAIQLGISRDRSGWMWGFFLGWVGVFILAVMRPRLPAELEEITPARRG